MEQHANKTIICNVLFLDIVDYSKRSVSEQIALKDHFNRILSIAIRDVPIGDRIILDTGDGAAISFHGDIEDALRAALRLRKSLLGEDAQKESPLQMRMGINLGPVQLVRDINGQPNIVGDGINVAQRVMGFSTPGQILVSRSYFEAVSRLAPDYESMFHNEGSRLDKHVREHEIFSISFPSEILATQTDAGSAMPGNQGVILARVQGYWAAAANWLDDGVRGFADASNQRALFVGVMAAPLLFLVVIVLVKVAHRSSAPEPAPQVAAVPTVAVVAPAAPEAAAAPPKPETKTRKKISNSRTRTLEQTATGTQAIVSIAVTPWGTVYLDGRMQGVSPPLAELQVVPGKHEIEIRNTTAFKIYSKSILVKSGEKITIKHNFTD